ncbi:hypothetical protein HNQ65_003033 [Prosthecobacter vanneervenii]|uniref:Uncharacterized protein n=1 Tax=Prosthecobacter vanneervenii TaxID=48466 RepID=A0A7W7YC85_9BACT|nr:hypothetical protein [Prosthecobacter vanneervenii]
MPAEKSAGIFISALLPVDQRMANTQNNNHPVANNGQQL